MNINKKDLYRYLGAEKFQRIVFFVEKIKYKIIDRFFPNIRETYERNHDKCFKRKLRKEPSETRQLLLAEYQIQKLAFRKELNSKKNRNYHYNPNYPTKFIKYLEWNKKIHLNSMKKNIIGLICIIGFTLLLGNPVPVLSLLFLIKNVVSVIIDFECVNLQNYNLERFKNKETYTLLEKKEEKKCKQNLERLGESIEPISKAITSQVELPTVNQVVDKITTIEQTRKLLEYAKEQYQYMKNIDEQRRR